MENIYNDNKYTKLCSIRKWEQFEGKNKEDCPYLKFFTYCARKAGGVPKGKNMNVSGIWVCEKTYNKLQKIVQKWGKKYHNCSGKRGRSALSMHSLQYSPAAWLKNETPEWVKEDYIYMREDFFIPAEV